MTLIGQAVITTASPRPELASIATFIRGYSGVEDVNR